MRVFTFAFLGKIAAAIFIAVCAALGFGPDRWVAFMIGVDWAQEARTAFILLGLLVAAQFVWQYVRDRSRPSNDVMPAKPRATSVPLLEAATRIYEATRGTLSAEMAHREDQPNGVLLWYFNMMAAKRSDGSVWASMTGIRPPSRIREVIDANSPMGVFEMRAGVPVLVSQIGREVLATELEVEESGIANAIKKTIEIG